MSGRPSSTPGLEVSHSSARHVHPSGPIPRPRSNRSAEALDRPIPPSTDPADPRPPAAKPPSARPSPADSGDAQASLRQNFFHLYSSSNSRSPSARTSSSSLQALNEGSVVDARSDHSVPRPPVSRRTSYQTGLFDPSSHDYPVYPDQSYAVLQSQIHPTYRAPFLWSRNSYPTRAESHPRFLRTSRTAGNTPDSSPGLFSLRGRPKSPIVASDEEGRVSSPFLHPTHLQPPKE